MPMTIHIRCGGTSRTVEQREVPDDDKMLLKRLQELRLLPPGEMALAVDRNPKAVVIRPHAVFG